MPCYNARHLRKKCRAIRGAFFIWKSLVYFYLTHNLHFMKQIIATVDGDIPKQMVKLLIGMLLVATFFTLNIFTVIAESGPFGMYEVPNTEEDILSELDTAEILVLARTLYTETKVAEEQKRVGEVIRNRVKSTYYPNTYRDVVYQPKQFSGMHDSNPQYRIAMRLTSEHTGPGWNSALQIAHDIYTEEDTQILPNNTYHFYSPVSVKRDPKWAEGIEPVHTVPNPNGHALRFAFYAGVK